MTNEDIDLLEDLAAAGHYFRPDAAAALCAAVRERDAENVRLTAWGHEQARLALCDVIGRVLGEETGDDLASGGDTAEVLAESIARAVRDRDATIGYLRSVIKTELACAIENRDHNAAARFRDVLSNTPVPR